jgi:hypothetical protein
MRDFETLIPGFYADQEGHLYLDMREFLVAHGIPDAPEVRRVVWEEIGNIFADLEVIEISD